MLRHGAKASVAGSETGTPPEGADGTGSAVAAALADVGVVGERQRLAAAVLLDPLAGAGVAAQQLGVTDADPDAGGTRDAAGQQSDACKAARAWHRGGAQQQARSGDPVGGLAGVGFAASCSEPPTPGDAAFVRATLRELLGAAGGDVAVGGGSIRAAAQLPGSIACPTPFQLSGWVWHFAAASARRAAAAGGGAGAGQVVAACAGGGAVAWSSQHWGAHLPPGAPDAPVLQALSARVLPAGAPGAALQLRVGGADPAQAVVLLQAGAALHTLPLLPAGEQAGRGAWSVPLPAAALAREGPLHLAVASQGFYSSAPEPLLVLQADHRAAGQLSEMCAAARRHAPRQRARRAALLPDPSPRRAAPRRRRLCAPGGAELLQQLHRLLLQPHEQLAALLAARAHDGGGEQAQEAEPCAPDELLPLRVASCRAAAAAALLAAGIRQGRLHVVRWVLQRLAAARLAPGAAGPPAEQALVARQRLAWAGGGTAAQQAPPLLLLAAASGDEHVLLELMQWSRLHGLPTEPDSSWRGVSLQQVLQAASAAPREQPQQGEAAPHPALQLLQRAGAAPAEHAQAQAAAPCGAKAGLLSGAGGGGAWPDLSLHVPAMLRAASLQELSVVLGPQGGLPEAVMSGATEGLARLLAAHAHSQAALDAALQLAALLGSSRLHMARLLLLHGADPCADGQAALAWAARRALCAGETEGEALLLEAAAASGLAAASISAQGGGEQPPQAHPGRSGGLAVAAWCRGLHAELAGLHRPGCAAALASLQQFLSATPPAQRSVAQLLAALQAGCAQPCCGLFLAPEEADGCLRRLLHRRGQGDQAAAAAAAGRAAAPTGAAQPQQAGPGCAGGAAAWDAPASGGQRCAPARGAPGPWHFLQCFGERTPDEEVQEPDVISAVQFDRDGSFLATGDRGGRVVLFERVAAPPRPAPPDARPAGPPAWGPGFEYRYLTELQSHEPEFDYLKSLEIEERINAIQWLPGGRSHALLSTNDKTIKLWKAAAAPACAAPRAPAPPGSVGALRLPRVAAREAALVSRARRVFANGHTYHIHSLSVNSDQATFLSADDLRINLWSLEEQRAAFTLVDLKPPNMDDLAEVITSVQFHPSHCATLAYASSRGCVRLADMRAAALCDRSAKVYEEAPPPGGGPRSFFSDVIASTSAIAFSPCGRYLLSRDYMALRVWDLAAEARPLATLAVHEHLRPRLCDLYDNDCMFDKFGCAVSGDGAAVATGTYNNSFRVFSAWDALTPAAAPGSGAGGVGGCGADAVDAAGPPRARGGGGAPWRGLPGGLLRGGATLEASRDPMATAEQGPGTSQDYGSKVLHLAWHPGADVVACASANSLYMFCA
ncbi:PP2AB2 [Scenedesmus sp. PABB004]|nr:PP2AB2 [Scenedesmus sp. PABB004]